MDKIQADIVLEILGRPADYVSESLKTLVARLGSEKGVKVIGAKHHDPVPVENSNDLFTSFAEVSLELDSIAEYYQVIFSYMPSHIEVISPENIEISNLHLNEAGNHLALRLHDYDSIAKTIIAERDILLKKLKEIAPNLFNDTKKDNLQ